MDWKYATNFTGSINRERTLITAKIEGPYEEEIAEELVKLLAKWNVKRRRRGLTTVEFIVERVAVKR